jgi:hypothetical protein
VWGQPAAPPPPKKSRTPIIIAIVVAVVLVLGCGGVVAALALNGNDKPTGTASTGPSAKVSGSASSTPSTPSGSHTGELVSYLLKAPAGSTPWVTKPDDETLDLAGAADFGADSSVWTTLLTQNGFTGGIARHWVLSGQIVEVTLFQFNKSTGATNFFNSVSSATGSAEGWSTPDFASGTNGGLVFISDKADDSGYLTSLGMAHIGDVFVNVTVSAEPPLDTAPAVKLLQDQCAKL